MLCYSVYLFSNNAGYMFLCSIEATSADEAIKKYKKSAEKIPSGTLFAAPPICC